VKRVKDRRVGTVIRVADEIAAMVLKDPDMVEVSDADTPKPAKRTPAKQGDQ